MGTASEPRKRKSADVRRTEIVAAAIEHFGLGGYTATSTEPIAKDAGISQPYLFRLFKTKRELFLACHEVIHQRVLDTFRSAAEGIPREERMEAMGKAYLQLLEDRTLLRFEMQSYAAASADPDIQAQVRARYGAVIQEVRRLTGAESHQLWAFFGSGMLLNVIAALDMPTVAGIDEWAALWDGA